MWRTRKECRYLREHWRRSFSRRLRMCGRCGWGGRGKVKCEGWGEGRYGWGEKRGGNGEEKGGWGREGVCRVRGGVGKVRYSVGIGVKRGVGGV